MPDIFYLISKWWKQIFLIMIISIVIAGIIVFLEPLRYLSVCTAVPGSSFSSDKGKIFNENLDILYSNLGNPEDLDVIEGTGQLDTIYLAVVDQFNLYDHYKVSEKGDAARKKAALLLKKYSRITKSDYRELKAKVWDTDKDLAPQLANALMEKIQSIHQDLQNENNAKILSGLKISLQKLKDSLQQMHFTSVVGDQAMHDTSGQFVLKNQLQKYQQLIGEYQLMIDSKPSSLLVVEKARAAAYADKPRRLEIMIAVAVLSFLFAFSLALVLEKRKTMQS